MPVNLKSSIDNSVLSGLFTIRPIFGVDLFTSNPRTFVNNTGAEFKTPLSSEPLAIGGIFPSDSTIKPVAFLASDDGIRSFSYEENIDKNLTGPLSKTSGISGVTALKLFEFNNVPKLAALKASMLSLLDTGSGQVESSATLSGNGLFKNHRSTIARYKHQKLSKEDR